MLRPDFARFPGFLSLNPVESLQCGGLGARDQAVTRLDRSELEKTPLQTWSCLLEANQSSFQRDDYLLFEAFSLIWEQRLAFVFARRRRKETVNHLKNNHVLAGISHLVGFHRDSFGRIQRLQAGRHL